MQEYPAAVTCGISLALREAEREAHDRHYMNLKPWRGIAVPHAVVLEGTVQKFEFVAASTPKSAEQELPGFEG
jgi:hypothetical protein